MPAFDWSKPVQGYTEDEHAHKLKFHRTAKARLKEVAQHLGWPKGTFDLRSNMAGPAVSGEITLHGERLYVQVSQSCMGPGSSIMIRTCDGRKDYHGGQNNFAALDMLNDVAGLAEICRRVAGRNH